MAFLFDTNAVIALLNDPQGRLAHRARQQRPSDIVLSAIVVHELFFGAFKSQRQERNLTLVESLPFEILSFDKEDVREAGRLRAWLAARGTPIGSYDVLIAGQARVRGLTLVTRNGAEFVRVPDLAVEDWEAETTPPPHKPA